MSESVLYRRYRPEQFDDVIGQDHIVSSMKGAIENDSFAHAYLFAGSRGTGKTSVARIFAREIGVSAGDLYEIDAASNRGIDDVRELRDAVSVSPMESPYKLYIIDEAHMLTKEAFNALLKTLEEPPAHVVFVLATTEVEKLPDTIISRCQQYTFHQPTRQVLRQVATDVAGKEGYTLEGAAAELIALLGEGSFRDTLGILQKVISATDAEKTITEDTVSSVTGAPAGQTVRELVRAIADVDTAAALATVHRCVAANSDVRIVTALVLQKLRAVLLLRFAPDMQETIKNEMSEDDFTELKELADDSKAVITSATIDALLSAYSQIRDAAMPELPLELAIIRMSENKQV